MTVAGPVTPEREIERVGSYSYDVAYLNYVKKYFRLKFSICFFSSYSVNAPIKIPATKPIKTQPVNSGLMSKIAKLITNTTKNRIVFLFRIIDFLR